MTIRRFGMELQLASARGTTIVRSDELGELPRMLSELASKGLSIGQCHFEDIRCTLWIGSSRADTLLLSQENEEHDASWLAPGCSPAGLSGTILDGILQGNRFVAFDILYKRGRDMRRYIYRDRAPMAREIVREACERWEGEKPEIELAESFVGQKLADVAMRELWERRDVILKDLAERYGSGWWRLQHANADGQQ